MNIHYKAMRTLVLLACFALQLSVFTCGFDIHVHAMEFGLDHVVEHSHDGKGKHKQDSEEHGCHLHASHTFTTCAVKHHLNIADLFVADHDLLVKLNLKKISFQIEHPPKLHYS